MATVLGQPEHARRAGKTAAGNSTIDTTQRIPTIPGETTLTLLAALLCISLVLGLFAWTRPLKRAASDAIGYQQRGSFQYTAEAAHGVYDADRVRTGDPVFRRIADRITLNFAYRFTSEHAMAIHGTYRLTAEITSANGWQRRFALQPRAAFDGGTFSTTATLDLRNIQAVIDALEQKIGVQQPQYSLTVTPDVRMEGTVAQETIQVAFAPSLTFVMDQLQLQAVKNQAEGQDVFNPVEAGLVEHTRMVPNTFSLLRLKLNIGAVRWLALLGVLAAIGMLLRLTLPIARATRGDETVRAQLAYGTLMVDVRDSAVRPDDRVVELATLDDLGKLAKRDGCMILHEVQGRTHYYVVQQLGITYRYRVTREAGTVGGAG